MKILFLFTYNKGLLSDFFLDLGQQLSADDHEVKIYSLKKHPGISKAGKIEIKVETKGGYLSDYYKIFNCIKEVSPDVVISNFSYANPALLAGKILNIEKNIVWVHSLKKHGDPWKYQIVLKSQFYKFADSVIVNSFILENELRQVFKVKKSKITAIPFWSNIEDVSSIPLKVEKRVDKIFIGCPGRFTVIKNQNVIIEALLSLNNILPDKVEVYFAGEGPTFKELEKKVRKYNLEKQVSFLGVLSAGQMRDFYEKMDLIILPSLYESFGLVFIETISLGVPVIVSKKFGALDFVRKDSEDRKRIIFDPEDPEQLAAKIIKLSSGVKSNKAFFKKIYTDHFDKDVIYKQVLKVLSE